MAADFPAVSDMDAFLINPTVKMSTEYVRRTADEWMPLDSDHDSSSVRHTPKKSLEPAIILPPFSHKILLPREYTSEEEAASHSDNDSSGFGSTGSEGDTDSLHSLDDEVELLGPESEREYELQHCSKAQPVYIISAGKAKVVSVSSSTQSSPVKSRPTSMLADNSDSNAVIFGSSKTYQRAQLAADNTVSRAASTHIPRLVDAKSPRRQPPTLPRLDVTPESGPTLSRRSQTPLASQRAELVKQTPTRADWPFPSPTSSPSSPVVPQRRMPKLFSGNSRRKVSNASDSSIGSSDSGYRTDPRHVPIISAPLPPIIDATPRLTRDDRPRRKMVPRGASERTPTIMLPPHPTHSDWPLRSPQDEGTLHELRRRSGVAAAATAQL